MDMLTGQELEKELQSALDLTDETSSDVKKKSDDKELYTERIDNFSVDYLQFEELTSKIMNQVDSVFDRITRIDRHSSEFIKFCGLMQRGTGYLAGACLNKIVWAKEGVEFPKLDLLNTHNLYRMISFCFRKCDAALSEDLAKDRNGFNFELMNLELSLANTLERLKATEVKIINFNSYKDFDLIYKTKSFSEKAVNKHDCEKHVKLSSFGRSVAFPALEDMLPWQRMSAQTEAEAVNTADGTKKRESLRSGESAGSDQNFLLNDESAGSDQNSLLNDKSAGSDQNSLLNDESAGSLLRKEQASPESICGAGAALFDSMRSLRNPCSARNGLRPDLDSEQELRPPTLKPEKRRSYQEILARAKARNEDPTSREIQLTKEEIHSLLADVMFRRNEPVLAAQLMAAINSS